ncbi:MAG TPA: biotin/lipoyl-binding protein [Candidatus Binatia bacterium]|jgi:multidrug efflux pump subunit AcrA (membrane-fusion protein)
MTNRRIIAITIIGLAVLAALGIAPRLWRDRQIRASMQSTAMEAPLVTVGFPVRAPKSSDLVLPGSIQAVQETAIYARVDGYLKRRLVNIGDRVQAGQILAEIDTPELNQQLFQVKATLAQSISALQQARATLQHNETQLNYNQNQF